MIDGFRRAALRLHNLPHRDREWILARLADDERERLRDLCQELKSEGIGRVEFPFDEMVAPVNERTADSVVESAVHPRASPATSWPRLRGLAPATAHALLEREPAWICAAIFNAEAWPWKAAVLQRFNPSFRQRLTQWPRREGDPPPALETALLRTAEAYAAGPLRDAGQEMYSTPVESNRRSLSEAASG